MSLKVPTSFMEFISSHDWLKESWDTMHEAHKKQVRRIPEDVEGRTDEPYVYHPIRVTLKLWQDVYDDEEETLGVRLRVFSTALLHDVYEDRPDMPREYDDIVDKWIQMLTKPPRAYGTRKARMAKYYNQIEDAPRHVKNIKLADIFDNLTNITKVMPRLFLQTHYLDEMENILGRCDGECNRRLQAQCKKKLKQARKEVQ